MPQVVFASLLSQGFSLTWTPSVLDERPLNGFKDQLCSLVFMALTDPSAQLQLVGIRTLTVLGAQPGTLRRKRKERVLVPSLLFSVLREEQS